MTSRRRPTTRIDASAQGGAPRLWFPGGGVALLAVLCYANTLPNGYCFDDVLIVQHDPKVTDPGRWSDVWNTDYWSESGDAAPRRDLLYRPLSLCTFRLLHLLWGDSPLSQHLLNVLLHALASVLVVRLGRSLNLPQTASWLAGALFAVLPIHTEAVNAIVGRADLLAAIGVLLALLAHSKVLTHASLRGRVGWCALAAVAAFAAMASKESGVVVIPLVVIFDAYWHGHARETARSPGWWSIRTVVRLSYVVLPLAVYAVLRYQALHGRFYQEPPLTKTVNVLVGAPYWQHLLGVIQLWGMYWAKSAWPAVLSIKYSINTIRLATALWNGHVLLGLGVIAVLTGVSIRGTLRGSWIVGALTVALAVSYLPVSNAFVLIRVFFAERVWYLPSVWAALLIGLALHRLLRHDKRNILAGALVLAVVGMVGRCVYRNTEWRDNGTLYAAALRDQPDGVGPMQLYGQWLVRRGRFSRGIELLEGALEIDVGNTLVQRSLGQAYLEVGRLREALRHLQLAESQVPGHPPTVNALRRVSAMLTGDDRELESLEARVEAHPSDVELELALVRRLREDGLVQQALRRFADRESAFASQAEWQYEYAVTLVMSNRVDQAIDRYERCLALDAERAQPAAELAMLLLERRRGDDLRQARRWADHAVGLAPRSPNVLACRAEVLAAEGDLNAAWAGYRRALELLPPDSKQRRMYQRRAEALGLKP